MEQIALNERLKGVVNFLVNERKVYNASDFAKMIGKSRSQMSEMLNGKRLVSDKTIDRIVAAFPELNGSWIKTGEGEMLKPAQNAQVSGGISQQNVNGDNNVHTDSSDETRLYQALYKQKCDENAALNLKVAKLLARLMEHGIDTKGCGL